MDEDNFMDFLEAFEGFLKGLSDKQLNRIFIVLYDEGAERPTLGPYWTE